MIRKMTLFVGIVAFSTCSFAAAQSPAEPSLPRGGANERTAMYEDIEVFRRILDGALLGALAHGNSWKDVPNPFHRMIGSGTSTDRDPLGYYLSGSTTASAGMSLGGHSFHIGTGAEGVYLKGYGAVFNIAVPWHFQKPVDDVNKPGENPSTQWDRVRSEMRGENVRAEPKHIESSGPSVADTVLKLLADNGRHFSQLTENEHLTVAVTLRPIAACTVCHDTNLPKLGVTHGDPATDTLGRLLLSRYTEAKQQAPVTPADQKEPASKDKGTEERRTEAANFYRLGELRQRQGRLDESIQAYERASHIYYHALNTDPNPTERDLAAAADVNGRLAQAYMLKGDKEKALDCLARQFVPNQAVLERPTNAKPTPTPESRQALPAKLVISAPKRLLDQVGSGKVSFDEFKKGATVDYLNFAPTKKSSEEKNP